MSAALLMYTVPSGAVTASVCLVVIPFRLVSKGPSVTTARMPRLRKADSAFPVSLSVGTDSASVYAICAFP